MPKRYIDIDIFAVVALVLRSCVICPNDAVRKRFIKNYPTSISPDQLTKEN